MGNQPRQPYDPNSNTYNPGWRNHPNLGLGGNQHSKNNFQNHPPFQPFQRPQFQPLFPQQPKPTSTQSFEAALEKLTLTTAGFVQSTNQFIEEARANFRNQESSIQNLETQSGKTLEDTTKKVDAQATTENAMEESSQKQENQQQQHSKLAAKRRLIFPSLNNYGKR
ncbi:hypothetical protein PIB30_091908 [Stylosanthes scabra]|uniref:Uncharacterized protein n=1 Tax=Stylosanthes scabra TaxID=79078 RepID=A0ABU6VV16_9FABA|nr:hypothetical protein [Stylosanthes scabra]